MQVVDRRAWTHLNPDTLALLQELADEGAALALLSNAPAELARHIEAEPWATVFRHRFFSVDLRLVKPDPEIYLRVCGELGASPGDLVFIDDRHENLEAAEALGITPVLYSDTPSLRSELTRLRAARR
jgi:putative hydrolase of the HAD superfamily